MRRTLIGTHRGETHPHHGHPDGARGASGAPLPRPVTGACEAKHEVKVVDVRRLDFSVLSSSRRLNATSAGPKRRLCVPWALLLGVALCGCAAVVVPTQVRFATLKPDPDEAQM